MTQDEMKIIVDLIAANVYSDDTHYIVSRLEEEFPDIDMDAVAGITCEACEQRYRRYDYHCCPNYQPKPSSGITLTWATETMKKHYLDLVKHQIENGTILLKKLNK